MLNLVETPKLEVIGYQKDFYSANRQPSLKQYYPNQDIKYALNPASGLEVVDITGAFVITYDSSIFENYNGPQLDQYDYFFDYGSYYGPSFPKPADVNHSHPRVGFGSVDGLEEAGFSVENFPKRWPISLKDEVRLSTGYAPLGCLSGRSFFIYSDETGTYKDPKITFKMIARLRAVNDPDYVTTIVNTYDVELVDSPLNSGSNIYRFQSPTAGANIQMVFQTSNNPNGPARPYERVPANLYINPFNTFEPLPIVVGPGVVEALGNIYIEGVGSELIIMPGTIFRAGGEVIIGGEEDEVSEIINEVVIESGYPIASCNRPVSDFRVTNFTNICNDLNKYDPVVQTALREENPGTGKQTAVIPLTAAPNPFSTATELRYELPAAGYVELYVSDLMGQRVATLVDGRQAAGPQTATFRPQGARRGLYVATLRTDRGVGTRLIELR